MRAQPEMGPEARIKRVVILGSTGSIGVQTLDVIARNRDRFEVSGLSCGSNVDLLVRQCRAFQPQTVAVGKAAGKESIEELERLVPEVLSGPEALVNLARMEADIVVMAVTGIAALRPLCASLRPGITVGLANKESIVAAGSIVMGKARKLGAAIIPVDSEHSAIFQCIHAGSPGEVTRIILTASGGPFAGKTREELAGVTVEETLRHPNWRMGPKITVDSATLMNKGLEVIEAHHLFGIEYSSIVVALHRESVIHSMVEFRDGAVFAQMSLPDMRLPIQYALTYPERLPGPVSRYEPWRGGTLTFGQPDTGTFPLLRLAYEAGRAGGAIPAVMSAANEVAVGEFLAGRIGFLDIARVVESVVEHAPALESTSIREILEADAYGRAEALAEAARTGGKGVH